MSEASIAALCEVCTSKQKKYRCPKCDILYCSVTCYKVHSHETCASRVEYRSITEMVKAVPKHTSTVTDPKLEEEITESGDRVQPELLEQLADSEHLAELLANRHLREYLERLNCSSNLAQAIERAMKEPIFLEFANECLKIVEPKSDNGDL